MPSFPGESGLLLRNEDLTFIVTYFLPFPGKKGEHMEQQDTKFSATVSPDGVWGRDRNLPQSQLPDPGAGVIRNHSGIRGSQPS